MSKEFGFHLTGQLVGVQVVLGKNKTGFDFGADHHRALLVLQAAKEGADFQDSDDRFYTGTQFLEEVLIPAARWSFGEFAQRRFTNEQIGRELAFITGPK